MAIVVADNLPTRRSSAKSTSQRPHNMLKSYYFLQFFLISISTGPNYEISRLGVKREYPGENPRTTELDSLVGDDEGMPIAVFEDGEDFHALFGRCPHTNGAMGLGWIEEGEAVCPLHHWRFKLSSGRCTSVRGESLHRFRSEVRDGEVWVEV